ncbi:unnamed protein product [Lepeophtheirus salmonis]|uniref:(salmon louse) hypothetical protein n=1 Tax=Lepeophtheirus salmonis TaxID=72036 RepID=A0A7R8D2R9_LEPSM|nr:unnamed protein product [Lepeophtheirus salmonis]CAF3004355.1 unnamed protein product [Lepeophtheirus salmonis]
MFVLHSHYTVLLQKWTLPPGPLSLPIVGSIPFLPSSGGNGVFHLSLAEKNMEKLYTVDVIWTNLIVINDFQLAKDLFNREDMSGRAFMFFSKYIKGYDGICYGVISNEGASWQTQRRFSLMKLKNLGFGRKSLESTVYEEVSYLFDIIEKEIEPTGDILVKELFNFPVINVIWQVIASMRCDYNNAQEREILKGISDILTTGVNFKSLLGDINHILPYSKAEIAIINFKKIVEKLIDDHEENLDENAPNDFIDIYLIEMRRAADSYFTKKQLAVICMDLFVAGSETSSITLTWMLMYMAIYEDIQEKCFNEIQNVLGSSNPREEDMPSLVYCMATLSEIQRLGNTAPASLTHKNLEDIVIEGYKFPKGTIFVANLRKFHLDPTVFENPQEFNPLLGSIPFLPSSGDNGIFHLSLAEKYGKLYTVDVIWTNLIVINDFQLAKDLFNREDMSGRAFMFFNKYIKGYDGICYGVISNEGASWQTQRRFSLMKLKNLGFGRKSLESTVYEEVSYLFDIIEKEIEPTGDILVKELFNFPVINVIWQVIASMRCDYNNAQEREILKGISDILTTGVDFKSLLGDINHILPYSKTEIAIINLKKIVEKLIDDHEENLDENAPNDFIDIYLIEMRRAADSYFTKKQLAVICMDLFVAGSETSSTTLTWMLMYMAIYEDIQEKCFNEIQNVLGSSNPREEDMPSLVYCMATLSEIQRLGNTAPASLTHKNLEDIVIEGYKFPKGTIFVANLRKFHLDPTVFENPQEFNPLRFYKKEVDAQLVPFGFGKRICMGISMAKKELYYFFIMVIQKYKIRPSSIHKYPDPNNFNFGTTSCPKPFYVNLLKR